MQPTEIDAIGGVAGTGHEAVNDDVGGLTKEPRANNHNRHAEYRQDADDRNTETFGAKDLAESFYCRSEVGRLFRWHAGRTAGPEA